MDESCNFPTEIINLILCYCQSETKKNLDFYVTRSKEIISISIGRCGNKIGTHFWKILCEQHGIDEEGNYIGQGDIYRKGTNVYFHQTMSDRYLPRSILVDSEPTTINSICAQTFIFDPNSCIVGHSGTGSNWAKGHYSEGFVLADTTLNLIRKDAEACDYLQGFQITHSLGGGTGSGLGALLLAKIREEYTNKMISTFSVFPSSKVSDKIVESYNTVLSLDSLINLSDEVVVLDNETLYDICFRGLKIINPTYHDLNTLISKTMDYVTCNYRLPSSFNLRSLATNLIPFPRQHFLVASISHLRSSSKNIKPSDMWILLATNGGHMISTPDPRHGRYLSIHMMTRGQSSKDTWDWRYWHCPPVGAMNSSYFIEWIPNMVKFNHFDVSCNNCPTFSAAMLANSSSIVEVFRRISTEVHGSLKEKSFLHWYTGEGMEEMEFQQAQCQVKDLIDDYEAWIDIGIDDDDEGDY